jgi:biopolymer transport protein ExbD
VIRHSYLTLTLVFLVAISPQGVIGARSDEHHEEFGQEKDEDLPKGDYIIINPHATISTEDILETAPIDLIRSSEETLFSDSIDTSESSSEDTASSVSDSRVEFSRPLLSIEIANEGNLTVNDSIYDLGQLGREMQRLVAMDSSCNESRSCIVHISADPEVKSGRVIDVAFLVKQNMPGTLVDVSDSLCQPLIVIMPGVMMAGGNAPAVSLVVNSKEVRVGCLVSIDLREPGEFKLNHEPIAYERIEPLARALFERNKEGHNLAVVRVDGDVEWSRTLECLKVARNAGAGHLALLRGMPMGWD